MGEARARALYAWKNSMNRPRGSAAPPESVLYRWRQNHPKGRGFSCYDQTIKVGMPEVVNILKGFNPFTGIALLLGGLKRGRQQKGARFAQAAQRGN